MSETASLPNITYTDVVRAAQRISVEGNKPTIAAVRQRLGRGSFTTINKHLVEWKTSLGVPQTGPLASPDIPDQVAEAAKNLWEHAVDQASATFAQERERIAEEQDALKETLAESNQKLVASESREVSMRAQLQQALAHIASLETSVSSAAAHHESEMQRIQAAHEETAATLKSESEGLRQELTNERRARSEVMSALEQRSQEFSQAEKRLARAVMAAEVRDAEHASQVDRLKQSHQLEIERMRKENEELQRRMKRLGRVKKHGPRVMRRGLA